MFVDSLRVVSLRPAAVRNAVFELVMINLCVSLGYSVMACGRGRCDFYCRCGVLRYISKRCDSVGFVFHIGAYSLPIRCIYTDIAKMFYYSMWSGNYLFSVDSEFSAQKMVRNKIFS